jgi:hypothetical protein
MKKYSLKTQYPLIWILSGLNINKGSSFFNNIRYASSTADYDFDAVYQVSSELRDKKHRLTQKVRPHFIGKSVNLPSRLAKNFVPFDLVTPPKGYELLCPKAPSFYHIDRPLDITELELRGKLKDFLTYLESDKNYIVNLIAQYTPNEIGFRTVIKSFYLSSNVPVKKITRSNC